MSRTSPWLGGVRQAQGKGAGPPDGRSRPGLGWSVQARARRAHADPAVLPRRLGMPRCVKCRVREAPRHAEQADHREPPRFSFLAKNDWWAVIAGCRGTSGLRKEVAPCPSGFTPNSAPCCRPNRRRAHWEHSVAKHGRRRQAGSGGVGCWSDRSLLLLVVSGRLDTAAGCSPCHRAAGRQPLPVQASAPLTLICCLSERPDFPRWISADQGMVQNPPRGQAAQHS